MLLNDDTLLGAHFDKGLSSFDVYIMLQRMSQLAGGRAVTSMAVVGNLTCGETDASCFMSKSDFRNGQYLITFAQAFDFNGHVGRYEQGTHANKNDRVQAAGNGQMLVYSATVASIGGNPSSSTGSTRCG